MHANNTPRERGSQSPKPNEFVLDIWRHQLGEYFCISIASPSRDLWHNQFFPRDDLHLIGKYIRHHVDNGYDVYFATNGFNRRERTKASAEWGVWLYADLDEVNPLTLELEPTLALRTSSGRYQGWWRCDDVVSKRLAKALVRHVKADRDSWAANKVLRIPGTINHKPGRKRHRVTLIWDGGRTYRVSELERLLPKERKRKRLAATPRADMPIERRLRWYSARQYMQPAVEGRRSDMIAGLIYTLHEDGYGADDIACALLRCPSFIDKRGRDEDRAYKEIDNCLENQK